MHVISMCEQMTSPTPTPTRNPRGARGVGARVGARRRHTRAHARRVVRERTNVMPAFNMSALALALPRTTSTSSVKAPSAARLAAKKSVASVVAFAPRATAPMRAQRGALVVTAGGKSIGCTLGGTRRKRARTSGFRTRIASASGRKVLKNRRAKGRKVLAPAGAVRGWNKEKK